MIPKPTDLQATAAEAQRASELRRKKEAATAKRERAKRIREHKEGKFDWWVNRAVRIIEGAASDGRFTGRLELATFPPYGDNERLEAYQEVWKQVAAHFEAAGYKAKLDYDHEIEYEGLMDPSPVPGKSTYYLRLDWTPE